MRKAGAVSQLQTQCGFFLRRVVEQNRVFRHEASPIRMGKKYFLFVYFIILLFV